MGNFDGNAGMSKLAHTLADRMRKENASPLVLDFGEIQANGSLITNTFPVAVPKGSYSVCRSISGYTLATSESSWTGHVQEDKHNHGSVSGVPAHSHDVPMPGLKAGDRVLVAWVQNEACVVDVIVRS